MVASANSKYRDVELGFFSGRGCFDEVVFSIARLYGMCFYLEVVCRSNVFFLI